MKVRVLEWGHPMAPPRGPYPYQGVCHADLSLGELTDEQRETVILEPYQTGFYCTRDPHSETEVHACWYLIADKPQAVIVWGGE